MRNKISAILIGLLFFSALATGFHHHDDNKSHVDCPVCIASNHTPAVSDNGANLSHREIVLPFEAPEKIFYLPMPEKVSSPARAPPACTVFS